MRVLIDLDGVVADWDAEFDRLLDIHGDVAAGIPRTAERTSWNIKAGRTTEERRVIDAIFSESGFYARLQPIRGAVGAVRAMGRTGIDVRFCTTPWVPNPTCASDKSNWVLKYFGPRLAARVIQTGDKTLVRGDFLVDDRPEVTGEDVPSWEHIVYTAPYNLHIDTKRRLTRWSEWREVFA